MTIKGVLAAGDDLQALTCRSGNVDNEALEAITRMHAAALAALMLQPVLAESLEAIRDLTRKLAEGYPAIDAKLSTALGTAVAIVRGIVTESTAPAAEPVVRPRAGGRPN